MVLFMSSTKRVLRKGSYGAEVKELQQKLFELGLFTHQSQVDGDFGGQTLNAVIQFQHRTNLVADGIVGSKTWEMLANTNELPKQETNSKNVISLEQASMVYDADINNQMFADLTKCLLTFDIVTTPRIRHFLSQTGHESGGLRWLKEFASGEDYEWRDDLGNDFAGAGVLYKGAGVLQLTGKYNYQFLADWVNDPQVMTGGCDYVAEVYPFTSAGVWWYRNNMNALCDTYPSVEAVTLRVNGGYNGLEDRKAYYDRAVRYIA